MTFIILGAVFGYLAGALITGRRLFGKWRAIEIDKGDTYWDTEYRLKPRELKRVDMQYRINWVGAGSTLVALIAWWLVVFAWGIMAKPARTPSEVQHAIDTLEEENTKLRIAQVRRAISDKLAIRQAEAE